MTRLAVHGGFPEVPRFADRWPRISQREEQLVQALLAGGIVHQKGTVLQTEFERQFAVAVGEPYCVSFASGTAAIEAALAAVGVGPGSRVVMPSYGYPSGAVAALALGARPLFIDCADGSLQGDPDAIVAAANEGATAILVQHCWGGVCDIERIQRAAAREHVPVVADCSHSFGATWDDARQPLHFDVGVYSLGPGKWVSGGELGVAVCSSPELYDRCIMYSGMNRPRSDLTNPADWAKLETCYSVKSRPHAYALALARGSLDRVDEKLQRASSIAAEMAQAIHRRDWLSLENCPKRARRVYWRVVVEVADSWSTGLVSSALHAEGIRVYTNEYAPPLHQRLVHRFGSFFELLKGEAGATSGIVLPRAERLASNTLTLHVPVEPDIDYAAAFERTLRKLERNADVLRRST